MKYKVTNKIGEGSYGAVYLAFNLYTKQKVAIKRIVKNKENEIDELELKNEEEPKNENVNKNQENKINEDEEDQFEKIDVDGLDDDEDNKKYNDFDG